MIERGVRAMMQSVKRVAILAFWGSAQGMLICPLLESLKRVITGERAVRGAELPIEMGAGILIGFTLGAVRACVGGTPSGLGTLVGIVLALKAFIEFHLKSPIGEKFIDEYVIGIVTLLASGVIIGRTLDRLTIVITKTRPHTEE
jgi:hypothetical protein